MQLGLWFYSIFNFIFFNNIIFFQFLICICNLLQITCNPLDGIIYKRGSAHYAGVHRSESLNRICNIDSSSGAYSESLRETNSQYLPPLPLPTFFQLVIFGCALEATVDPFLFMFLFNGQKDSVVNSNVDLKPILLFQGSCKSFQESLAISHCSFPVIEEWTSSRLPFLLSSIMMMMMMMMHFCDYFLVIFFFSKIMERQ